ncbi:RecB-family nuclease [Acidianus sp. HS-5]|uniref:RecB-family nuclease n=1 Tax=Acidianus sp. HS-5 TaxID=2886040 RepID=UPI001F3E2595|nr:RecB-family nuclease [Acidianus sp. HS-5]BDC19295.1 exonuclease [Acidianus sp. HS-5]
MRNIIVGLHNITSSQRLIDFAKIVFNLGVEKLVITKASGTAAQVGIPEVGKLAFKLNKSLLILPDLKDSLELLKPSSIYLVSSNAKDEINVESLKNGKEDQVLIVFPGIESGFTKIEQSIGNYVHIPKLLQDLGPEAEAAILLYMLL